MNLFLRTRSLTPNREDHLTEFLAAALDADQAFRGAYERTLLDPVAETREWTSTRINRVRTQVWFPEVRGQPDLVLEIDGGRTVLCEHKLDASETELISSVDAETLGQLERYLRLDVDGVAYFRSSWNPPSEEVLVHPRYVAPSGREHFLWEDLYEPLLEGTHDLVAWLREGFESLGFTPPHGTLGRLHGEDSEYVRANRRNFAKLWEKTRSECRRLGWKVDTGAVCELYLRGHESAPVSLIYVSPLHNRARVLLIRVAPVDADDLENIEGRISDLTPSLPVRPEVEVVTTRPGNKRPVIDVRVPLRSLLAEEGDPLEMAEALVRMVVPVVEVSSI